MFNFLMAFKDYYCFVKIFHRFGFESSEAVTRKCSVKKLFLKMSQNSQENACARVSFEIKLQALGLQLY